jgi:asparaginyl-tRNA synthetase
MRIIDIHNEKVAPGELEVKGWVKTHRRSKNVSFLEVTDGSSVKGLQVVAEPDEESYLKIADKLNTGSSVVVNGQLVESPAKGQKFELQAKSFELIGEADAETYPLQKKGHTLEFLRENMHLRPRANTFGAVFRVRSKAAMAIHSFFQERNFVYVHTPIITNADCEGAGEQFLVTSLDISNTPKTKEGKIDFDQDFFKSESTLTVSGQLEAEIFATALKDVYTFGPTFRAENSNTTRHLAEFWMIEPEMSFCDLEGNINIAEDFIKYVIKYVLDNCMDDLEFFQKRDWTAKNHIARLEELVTSDFKRMDYTEAIEVLEKSGKKFEFPVSWGIDLQSEHERFLTENYAKGPLTVVNYPKEIKAFYMRLNEDEKTVRAMDMLVPGLGEIIGGSQREERYDVLLNKIKEAGLPEQDYSWYLELRKFGTVPHSGFGLGFERLLMYLTGMQNIRDVIPFPRFPGFAGVV